MRKSIICRGLTLSYVEQNETGNPIIFFIHGNSGSANTWKYQFKSAVLNPYRLIAFDLPGHGDSSGSDNPLEDYSPIGTGKLMADAIGVLAQDNPFILVGFSYGTNVVAEMLAYGLKPAGIVLAGMCALGKAYGMEQVFHLSAEPPIFFRDEPEESFVRGFLKQCLWTEADEPLATLVADYFRVKHPFRTTLMQSAAEGKLQDEINLLEGVDVPVCIIFGQADTIVRTDYLDQWGIRPWREIFKLPGAGHYVYLDRPEAFNQLLKEYVVEQFTRSRAPLRT